MIYAHLKVKNKGNYVVKKYTDIYLYIVDERTFYVYSYIANS